MRPLERLLERAGYRTLNLRYDSRRQRIDDIAESIHAPIAQFSAQQSPHFIGHSMGGLIIRHYLHRYPGAGRVVMLGTPNHGSEVADFLKEWKIYRWLYGPAGQELVTGCARPPLSGYELGIIAGNASIDPVSSRIIGIANDGKVSVESTRLEGMKDHAVITATHSFFPMNKQAQQLTLHFLKHGSFTPPCSSGQ